MANELLRVGVIGIGLYATIAHVPQLRQTGRAEVVAISRRNAERLAFSQQQLGVADSYTDWREMLDKAKLDAVVISTPHDQHAEQGLASLQRGLHVLMEKPLALTAADAWKLVAAAQETQRVLMVGYNRRFYGMWRAVKDLLVENGIGQIRQINLQLACYRRMIWEGKKTPWLRSMLQKETGWPDHYFDEWEEGRDWRSNSAESGGGMFSNTGSHFVDLVLWLAGSHPREVVAFSESLGMPAECLLNIQARLGNGVLVSISSADVESGGFSGQGSLVIIGEEGIVTFDIAKPQEVWVTRGGQREQIAPTIADTNAAAAFVATILDGAPNMSPPHEGAYATAFSEAIYQSAAERRIVTIP